MFTRLMALFYAPDEGAAGGVATLDAPVDTGAGGAEAPADTGEGTQNAQEPTAAGAGTDDLDAYALPDKSTRDFKRLTKVISNLQAENAKLKEATATAPAKNETRASSTSTDEHPALKGRQVDSDTGEVYDRGMWRSKEEVIEHYDLKAELTELKSRVDQGELSATEAKRQADLAKAQAELRENISADVRAAVKQFIPSLPDERMPRALKHVERDVYDLIEDAISDGTEFSAEMLQTSIRQAVKDYRDDLGVHGAQQIKDNNDYKQTHPVKPDGPTATQKDKDPLSMSKRDAGKLADAAARAAMAMRGR